MSSPKGSPRGIFAPVDGLSRRRQARSYAGTAGTVVGAAGVVGDPEDPAVAFEPEPALVAGPVTVGPGRCGAATGVAGKSSGSRARCPAMLTAVSRTRATMPTPAHRPPDLPRALTQTAYGSVMGLFGRRRRSQLPDLGRSDGPAMNVDLGAVHGHFAQFVATRRGVEAFLEPATNVSTQSLVLVATDGEWTRRAIGSRAAAYELAAGLGIPIYDVLLTGYPSRMREWSSRQRRDRRTDPRPGTASPGAGEDERR